MFKKNQLFVIITSLMLSVILNTNTVLAQTIKSYIPNEWQDSRYTVHNNGTITDKKTSLMWKRCQEGLSGNNCETGTAVHQWLEPSFLDLATLNTTGFAGYKDWRLPNTKELRTLVAYDRYEPSINSNIFPNTPKLRDAKYAVWSTSLNIANDKNAWVMHFYNGSADTYSRCVGGYTRLVRGGQ